MSSVAPCRHRVQRIVRLANGRREQRCAHCGAVLGTLAPDRELDAERQRTAGKASQRFPISNISNTEDRR